MSTPDNLMISQTDDGRFVCVFIGKTACLALFDILLPYLQKHLPTFADEFEGQFYGDVMEIVSLPKQHYMPIYNLIMQAAEQLASVSEYKTLLKNALESDERFNAKQ